MITLAGVELNPNLVWAERFNSFGVMQEAKLTLGGRMVVGAVPLVSGRFITLEATEDSGWLSAAMVSHLQTLLAPGLVFPLTFHKELSSVLVMMRHHEPPALELRPLVPRWEVTDEDFFVGSIKLIQV